MKVLFLDIDGVLNSKRSCLVPASHDEFIKQHIDEQLGVAAELGIHYSISCKDNVAIKIVNMLMLHIDRLVLISSHRKYLTESIQFKSPIHLKRLNYYLSLLGIGLGKVEFDITDDLIYINVTRGDEVAKYLLEHPEITHHIILDDGGDFYVPAQNLVQTDPEVGISRLNYLEALKYLGIDTTNDED